MNRILVLLVIVQVFTGCTSVMKTGSLPKSRIEAVDYRNYSIGMECSAYVGEPLIDRKLYEEIITRNTYQVQDDFYFKGGISTTRVMLQGYVGDYFRISGMNEKDNHVINLPGSNLKIGIDKDGHWDKTIMSSSVFTSPLGSGKGYEMIPEDALFIIVDSRISKSGKDYIHHEIVYTGMNADGIHFLYLEYTIESRSSPALKLDLVYPADCREMRFRQYVFKVIAVSPSEIRYTVEAD